MTPDTKESVSNQDMANDLERVANILTEVADLLQDVVERLVSGAS